MRAAALVGLGIAAAIGIAPAAADDVLAGPPSDLIVTVYRAPYRQSGSIDLDDLNGFALVTETRLVHLPAGLSRVRFEGVADGIEPASALVSGLPGTVIEKNRDARLLSPAALIASAVGKPVELLRSNRKTGKTERIAGTIVSDNDGVVFKTAEGLEALRCSGLPETFSFAPAADLSARPTLSVEVRTPRAVTSQVSLSYLARGFDWAADYTATLAADGKHLDLGAWVTLANSNGVSFPSGHVQVVAGKVNREDGRVEPIDAGGPMLAQCWPRGSTSDQPMILRTAGLRFMQDQVMAAAATASAPRMEEVMVTRAKQVQQEQLGDLKLYRVPERTTLAARQSKQVRLMDRSGIPVSTVYVEDIAGNAQSTGPAHRLLRTRNTAENHLGLPLPAGTVAVFAPHDATRLLESESGLRDIAVNEAVEIDMGASSDVQVSAQHEDVALRSAKRDELERVEVSNARNTEIQFELTIQLPQGAKLVHADHSVGTKDGRPIFRFRIPANQTVAVRYQTQGLRDGILRTP